MTRKLLFAKQSLSAFLRSSLKVKIQRKAPIYCYKAIRY